MKGLFAHDHVFLRVGRAMYSNGGLSGKALSRYFTICDHLILLTRQREVSSVNDRMTFASIKGTSFVGVPDFKSLRNSITRVKARKTIEREVIEADFLISRLPSSIGSIAIHYAKKHQKPYLVELVGCPWDALWNYGSALAKGLAPFAFLKTKRLVKHAKFVIYVTNEFLQHRYPTEGVSVGCSNVYIPVQDESVLHSRFEKIRSREHNDPIILGTAAAIDVKYKGQHYVIKTLSELARLGYDCEYHLAGGGSKDFLMSVAKQHGVARRVKFLGSLRRDKMDDYFDSIDIYIQPSKTEGLPRALIEAMSRACPAIGFGVGGIPELLDELSVIPKKDWKELTERLIHFFSNPSLMIQQAERNFVRSLDYTNDKLDSARDAFLHYFVNNSNIIFHERL